MKTVSKPIFFCEPFGKDRAYIVCLIEIEGAIFQDEIEIDTNEAQDILFGDAYLLANCNTTLRRVMERVQRALLK
jgi:hypothetical protein